MQHHDQQQHEQEIQHETLILQIVCNQGQGYKVELFQNQTKVNKFLCGICHNVCHEAVELQCVQCYNFDHDGEDDSDDIQDAFYCKQCLIEHLNTNNNTCPLNNNHSNCDWQDCEFVRDKIKDLKLQCPTQFIADIRKKEDNVQNNEEKQDNNDNDNCSWIGKCRELLSHLENDCQVYSKPMVCSYSKYGCKCFGNSDTIQHHMQNSKDSHLLLCVQSLEQAEAKEKANTLIIQTLQAQLKQNLIVIQRYQLHEKAPLRNELFSKIQQYRPDDTQLITDSIMNMIDINGLHIILNDQRALIQTIQQCLNILQQQAQI